MSGVNDRRRSRATQKFGSQQLDELAKQAAKPDADAEGPRTPLGTTPPPDLLRSRTATIHDPLTTVVLAEVSRRARTIDLDPDDVRAAVDEDEDADEKPATNTRRR